MHGANRLASNSLLEALVFSRRIVSRTIDAEHSPAGVIEGDYIYSKLSEREMPESLPQYSLAALQELMWEKVGVMRDRKSLKEAADILAGWEKVIPPPADRPSHELCNLVLAGRLMTESALLREESRGAHYRSDFPQPSPSWKRHIIFTK